MVLQSFVGMRKPGQMCRHLDGDRENCHLSNLRWGTSLENAADMVSHGTRKNALSDADVVAIRAALTRERGRAIASRFGISESMVSRIKSGERRASV